jgi:sugar lactone lactonase YvrE
MVGATSVLLDGLWFPEGPRWHAGKLWFSDMLAQRVMTVDLDGHAEMVVPVPGRPSGLGWLPDGRLLVVSMTDRRLLRRDSNGLTEVADLSTLTSGYCNDMVVDRHGRAYIGHFGFDLEALPITPRLAEIVLVLPDGTARIVADALAFPNGAVMTPDERTLVVAETLAARLTAFVVEPDGSLTHRRIWAAFDDLGFGLPDGRVTPDGICLDAEGAIWVASPASAEVLRVREGGVVTDRVSVVTAPYACMLGGPDRRTLFVLTAEPFHPGEPRAPNKGRIEMVQVAVRGVGLP